MAYLIRPNTNYKSVIAFSIVERCRPYLFIGVFQLTRSLRGFISTLKLKSFLLDLRRVHADGIAISNNYWYSQVEYMDSCWLALNPVQYVRPIFLLEMASLLSQFYS